MKKMKSIFDVRGTVLGITFVNSKTYGRHIRAARGTYSKVKVNSKFKKAAANLQAAMVPARMIKNAVEQYRADFTGGLFWQRLVSLFCKQHMQKNAFDLAGLENMEIRDDFPLERLWKPQVQVDVCSENATLNVTLSSQKHPLFSTARHVDGYRVQVIALFPNATLESASHTAASSAMIPLKAKVNELVFDLPLPTFADSFVICLKLEGAIKDTLMLGHSSKGMRIVKVATSFMNCH